MAQKQPKILVVDDMAILRATTVMCCETEFPGATVKSAADGQEAIKIFDHHKACGSDFDIIITDLQMPNMDGIALAEHIRVYDNAVSIILITGDPPEKKPESVNFLIEKGMSMSRLINAINASL